MLLTTKLYIPHPRTQLVSRPRLSDRLNDGLSRALTLISAPPGFGKTTLLSTWIDDLRNPKAAIGNRTPAVAWLSLDTDDNDPLRFWAYVVAALETQMVCATVHTLIQTAHPTPAQTIVTALLNDLAALREPFVLVLDDYHVITTSAIHESFAFLIEHLPAHVHVILATRADPPFSLARLRAHGGLNELRVDDLRFTLDEARALFKHVLGSNLPAATVIALHARTEGWVTGLQLAMLALHKHDDIGTFIQAFSGSHRYVLDYLVEEILRHQPAAVQDFLLITSVLDRLCAELCDAVAAQSDSQTMLEALEHANLFLIPLDDAREWFRYHHLFAEAMRDRLRHTHPDLPAQLHVRASVWYEAQGLIHEAVRHAIAAEDFERAAQLIEDKTMWWIRNEVETLKRWLTALPRRVIRSHPRLVFNHAWSLLASAQPDAAGIALQGLEEWLVDPIHPWPECRRVSWLAEVNALRAAIARQCRDLSGAIEHGRRALELMHPCASDLRAVTSFHLGNTYTLKGDLEAATLTLIEAADMSRVAGHSTVYLGALHSLAVVRVLEGRLHEAESIYLRAIQYVGEQPQPIFSGIERIGICDLYLEWNDIQKAQTFLAEGLSLAEQSGDMLLLRLAYMTAARLKQTQRDASGAHAYLDQAAQLTPDANSWNAALVAVARARLALAQGDLRSAVCWAQDLPSSGDELAYVCEVQQLTLIRVWLAAEKYRAAGNLIAPLRDAAQRAGRGGRVIEVDMLHALWDWRQGRTAQAFDALGRALTCAMPEGYVRLFVDEGAPMQTLLSAFSQHCPPVIAPYVHDLLGGFPAGDPPQLLARDTLSERELEVLRMLAAGCSYREVAQTLVIALSTVQSHVRGVYRKLDAHSGRQAVARARALKLIP